MGAGDFRSGYCERGYFPGCKYLEGDGPQRLPRMDGRLQQYSPDSQPEIRLRADTLPVVAALLGRMLQLDRAATTGSDERLPRQPRITGPAVYNEGRCCSSLRACGRPSC